MFENYSLPDECRMCIVCSTLDHYWARREFSEIEEMPFHKSFQSVLKRLAEEDFELPFTWDRNYEWYTEVHDALRRLTQEGALLEVRPNVYRYYVDPHDRHENDGRRKIRAYYERMTGAENKLLHCAASSGYTTYSKLVHE